MASGAMPAAPPMPDQMPDASSIPGAEGAEMAIGSASSAMDSGKAAADSASSACQVPAKVASEFAGAVSATMGQ